MGKKINLFIEGELPLRLGISNYKTNLDFWTIGCIYQGLRMYDENYHLTNRLIEHFYYDDDINAFVIVLKNAFWSDGTRIVGSDIKYSIESRLIKKNNFQIRLFLRNLIGVDLFLSGKDEQISGIKVKDEKTVVFYMSKKDAYLENILLLPISNPNIGLEIEAKKTGDMNITGCGPFIPTSIDREKISFSRNKLFHLGTPLIEQMDIYYGDSYLKKRFLSSGKIDFIQIGMLELELLDIIPKQYKVYPLDTLYTTNISFNFNKSIFNDIENRLYLERLIDREQIINDLCKGYAKPLFGFYPETLIQSFDIKRIKCEKFINEDINLKNKFSLFSNFTIGFREDNEFHKKIAFYLIKRLNKIGKIRAQGYKNIKDAFENNVDLYIHDLKHQIIPLSNKYFIDNADNFKTNEFKKLLCLYNRLGDENVDIEFIQDFELEFRKTIPMIPLFSVYDIQVIHDKFTNLKPDGRGVLWNIHEINY